MSDLATVLELMYHAAEIDDEWGATYNVELMLATPEGAALAALVEATLAWRGQWVPDVPDGASTPEDMRLLRAIDAYREATT